MLAAIVSSNTWGRWGHVPDPSPQRSPVELPQVDAVERNRSLGRREQASQAFQQRRLAGARTTDQRDGHSRAHVQADPLEDRRIQGARVTEADLAEGDPPLERGDGAQPVGLGLLGLVDEDVLHAAEQHRGVLPLIPGAEQGDDRTIGQEDERIERDELADAEIAGDDLPRADVQEHQQQGGGDEAGHPGVAHRAASGAQHPPAELLEVAEHASPQ